MGWLKKISSTKVLFFKYTFWLQKTSILFLLKEKFKKYFTRNDLRVPKLILRNDEFYKNFCKSKNFIYLNGENVLHPKTSKTIMKYIEEDEENYEKVKKNFLENNKKINCLCKLLSRPLFFSRRKRNKVKKRNFAQIIKLEREARKKSYWKNLADYEKGDEINEFEQILVDENNEEDENILVEEAKIEEETILLTLFRMGFLGAAHGWRGRSKKGPLPP